MSIMSHGYWNEILVNGIEFKLVIKCLQKNVIICVQEKFSTKLNNIFWTKLFFLIHDVNYISRNEEARII